MPAGGKGEEKISDCLGCAVFRIKYRFLCAYMCTDYACVCKHVKVTVSIYSPVFEGWLNCSKYPPGLTAFEAL